MPRAKTGDKRAAILRAATKTIADDGIGASTASIAKAAGVAEGSLFRYFPDKDKLLNELSRELKLDLRSATIAGFPLAGSLRKRIQHIWNAYLTWGMESSAKSVAGLAKLCCAFLTESTPSSVARMRSLASSSLTVTLSARSPTSHPIADASRRNTPRLLASLSTVAADG
jgi:AcrR family transcriptional regulator